MMMSRQLLVLLLVSVAIFGGGANAMTYSLRGKDITSSIVLLLDPFGLLAGGSLDINMSVSTKSLEDTAPFVFLCCTYAEAMNVEIDPSDPATCAPEAFRCAYVSSFDNTSLVRHVDIAAYATYYLCVVHCPNSTATASYDLSVFRLNVANPNGEQLTCGLMPYPALFGCVSGLWVAALVAWLVFVLASFRRATRIHVALAAFPMIKIAWAVLAVSWWREISAIGKTPTGGISVAFQIFAILSEVSFFFIVMGLGAGWGISSTSIKRDFPIIFLITILLGVAQGLDSGSLKSDSLTQLTIWLAHVLLRITAVLHSFVLVNRNIQDLDAHALIGGLGVAADIPADSPIVVFTERRNILMSYKQLVVGWLVADLAIYFALLVFVKDWVWVPDMLYECTVLIFFLCLSVVLRVRPTPVLAAERGQQEPNARPIHNARLQQRVALLLQQQREQQQQQQQQRRKPSSTAIAAATATTASEGSGVASS